MRARRFALACLLLAVPAAAAHAEADAEVTATRDLRLRARPGETATVVGRADKGDQLTVLDTWGRWLRVRAGRRVGWVTRSQVAARDVDAAPRQRDRRAGFSGKPRGDALQVTVAIDRVSGFDDPRTKATCVLDLTRGDTVTVIGRGHDGWMLVEQDGGAIGWIPAAAVTDAGRFAGDPRGDAPRIEVVDVAAPPPPARPVATGVAPGRVRATVIGSAGGQTFAMRQTGGGDALATASGPSAALAADARMRVAADLWLGAAADAELGSASLIYATADERSAPMATRGLALDARAAVGWGHTWHVAARAGYHYASLAITSERAEAMLVGEQVGGVTVGVAGALPLGRRLALAAAVDVMPAGAQRPAELPPGLLYATSARAAWARTTLTMQLPARIVVALAYRGGVASAALTDGAETPSTATRTDQSHTVTAGLGLGW